MGLGDRVFQGDTLITTAGSSVGLTFIDNTLFSMTDAGRLVLDRLIFNPDGAGNELSLSLVQGVFAFVSGEIAGSDGPGMTIRTPIAVIGVRGTTGGGAIGDSPATGDFQGIVALLAPLVGSLGGIDVIGNAVLTLFVELATAGILSNGEVQPTDFTPELQAALANAIVSLRISLAQMLEELEPGAGGSNIPQGGGDADPAINEFFTPEELLEFGQEFGGSPLGDVASLLGLLEQLAGLLGPETDPNLPLTNIVETGPPEEAGSPLTALPINMIVTGSPLVPQGLVQLFQIESSGDYFSGRSLNESPFIGFVKAESELETPIFFGVIGGTAVPHLENFGTPEAPEYFFYDHLFKFNAPAIGDGGEELSFSFDYFASSDGIVSESTVDILVRSSWDFGVFDEAQWGYVTSGTSGTDIIYANPFVMNYFDLLHSSSNDGRDGITLLQILEGGDGMDALVGTEGYDNFYNNLDGDDYLEFEAIEDLRGGPGDDLLFGLGGKDILNGGTGNDWLVGDYPGGYGEDTFLYRLSEDSGDDIIFDFNDREFLPGTDNLALEDVAEAFDTLEELDSADGLAAGFSVFDDGEDVTVSFGQGGGSTKILGIGNGDINTFAELAGVVDLFVNDTQLNPPPPP